MWEKGTLLIVCGLFNDAVLTSEVMLCMVD
jgi:hypothetical protein